MGGHRKISVTIDGLECWPCSGCEVPKPVSGFYKNRTRWNGITDACRVCLKSKAELNRSVDLARHRRYKRRNAEKIRAAGRKYGAENRALCASGLRKWRRNNRAANAAHKAVLRAVRKGVIAKPLQCECCGSSRSLSGHHDSYERDRWLVVCWMCHRCHGWTHARRKDQSNGIWNVYVCASAQ